MEKIYQTFYGLGTKKSILSTHQSILIYNAEQLLLIEDKIKSYIDIIKSRDVEMINNILISGQLLLKYKDSTEQTPPTYVSNCCTDSGDRLYMKQNIWTSLMNVVSITDGREVAISLNNKQGDPNVAFYVILLPGLANIHMELDISKEDINEWISNNAV